MITVVATVLFVGCDEGDEDKKTLDSGKFFYKADDAPISITGHLQKALVLSMPSEVEFG
ncbi:MAG: hypothetical protein LBP56_08590 [Odoribacteraceae bacterium]|nr:hypothetical protein [Odoribacteraceae bacterium]